MENARNVGKARVVVANGGELHAYVAPEVMYNLEACQEVIRGIVGIYHRTCHSGLIISFKLAVSDAAAS
jgi:hypothetical protein